MKSACAHAHALHQAIEQAKFERPRGPIAAGCAPTSHGCCSEAQTVVEPALLKSSGARRSSLRAATPLAHCSTCEQIHTFSACCASPSRLGKSPPKIRTRWRYSMEDLLTAKSRRSSHTPEPAPATARGRLVRWRGIPPLFPLFCYCVIMPRKCCVILRCCPA